MLAAVRALAEAPGRRRVYAQRQAIEGAISQGVRAFELGLRAIAALRIPPCSKLRLALRST